MTDITEEIELAVDNLRANMPARIKSLITLAKMDLHDGPIYVDETGLGEGAMGEEGHTRFDFERACAPIRDWADDIGDIDIEIDYDEETEESVYESIDGSAKQIKRAILGSLSSYI